ncbi:hypothetical protein BDR07DRAFT_133859 [Suillus spraguei]|nr:hypothetical protein BDR07DRAFT_133859 [Suillus spraguei]
MTLRIFRRRIVLTFSIATILTSFVFMIIIPAWTTPDSYVPSAPALVFSVLMGIYPSRGKGNAYILFLTTMLITMYATVYSMLADEGRPVDPLVEHIQYAFLTFVYVIISFVFMIAMVYEMYMGHAEGGGSLEGGPSEGGPSVGDSLERGSLEVRVSEVENLRHILISTVETITPDPESHPKYF